MTTEATINLIRNSVRLSDDVGTESMGAWFLGPRGESNELLKRLINLCLDDTTVARKISYPNDPPWSDPTDPFYEKEADRIETYLHILLRRLERFSIPWYSYRYQAHMNWDTSLPAVAAYFGAMLYNQNNVAAEGSPVTTAIEIEVAQDICRMVGYGRSQIDELTPWGHITCDGTVANIEALWAARNRKLYPFAIRRALEEHFSQHTDFEVQVTGGGWKPLVDLDWWELLNLTSSVTLEIPERLKNEKGISEEDFAGIDNLSVQDLGLTRFAEEYDDYLSAGGELRKALANMSILGSASSHYSLPKAATLMGLGSSNYVGVRIDENARVHIDALEDELRSRIDRKLPVMAVVAIMGSTQESAVDQLSRILDIREDFRERGADFHLHADAAWGGYFASLLHPPATGSEADRQLRTTYQRVKKAESDGNGRWGAFESGPAFAPRMALEQIQSSEKEHTKFAPYEHVYTPEMTMSEATQREIEKLREADSVTIDPHKAGFIPYPAGSVCYRDGRMPQLIQNSAPVVFHGGVEKTVGVYGIEGSKPGAAPAAVWFSHKVIRPDQSGYGKILGKCIFNAKRIFAELASMRSPLFRITTLQEVDPGDVVKLDRWKALNNEDLWDELSRSGEHGFFRSMGPDLIINAYAVNPKLVDETGNEYWNSDPEVASKFNDCVYRALSIEYEGDDWPPVVVTGSEYESNVAEEPIKSMRRRLGINHDPDVKMNFLISTTMNPWLSDADGGKRNMVREVAESLRSAIEAEVVKFRRDLSERKVGRQTNGQSHDGRGNGVSTGPTTWEPSGRH